MRRAPGAWAGTVAPLEKYAASTPVAARTSWLLQRFDSEQGRRLGIVRRSLLVEGKL